MDPKSDEHDKEMGKNQEGPLTYKVPDEHVFKGVKLHDGMLHEGSEEADIYDNLELTVDDCIVASYPKSGTTWTQEIVWLLHHGADTDKAKETTLTERFSFIEMIQQIRKVPEMLPPKLIKTHVPYSSLPRNYLNNSTTRPKVVYIARNPKDTAVSYFHFYRANRAYGLYKGSWSDFFEMFINEYTVYGCWFKHVVSWHNFAKMEPNILFLKYEDMKKKPTEQIHKIATFLGKDIDKEEVLKLTEHTKFESMKSNKAVNYSSSERIDASVSPFMRKGQIGDWKNYFTVAQNERFMMMYEEKLKGTDLTFEFE
ncbi:unnamed protein product [Owenia fusiformis]|uniref:Sulfotransferase domain-containing protein n=1 Tax=Owenia fusiformis TaxID=6347 RepID=A0A8S4P1T5_OWEFU|nr:unnamed protein product [Owenia fusiformis]